MALVHQIWHGDSAELGLRFQPKRMIQSVITDPPFGVDNQSNMAVTAEGKNYARKIANDESPEIAMATFTKVMGAIIPGMKDESDIYVFTAHQVLEEWLTFTRNLFSPHGFTRKAVLVWQKDGPGMGDLNSWGMGCEFILYYKRGSRGITPGTARRNNVLHVPQLRPSDLVHPHEKPTALLQLLIQHSTSPGDFVVDPFGGSGSLVRAAEQCGRSAVAIEYDKDNYDLALKKLNEGEGGGMQF
jgi:site-specific DNA-methyltransferase (adenine-specific)